MSTNSRFSDSEIPKKKSKSKKPFGVLLSCCLFLAVACGCLLAALVLIGKHIVYNTPARSTRSNLENKVPERLYWRLPNDTRPLLYEITLKPDLESGLFQGIVNITVNVTKSRKDIILNSKNLTIDTVRLTHFNDSKVLPIENVQEDAFEEILIIQLKEAVKAGLYRLDLAYSGNLNKTIGFYRSKPDNATGAARFMATSKFEPTYARQAYPCFDEPNLKAKYKVHLLKPKDEDYTALSNYPQIDQEDTDEGVLIHFEETVPMSTYLSCFIVSDFQYTSTTFENGDNQTPFRVYASPHQLSKTTYAGEVGKKCIQYYITYFNIPYPLPKLDMVAIPDFVSGAMEHWGLVTYRETALLYDSSTHSESNKERVASVVAHELAHSWFGNLVTMDWWNNLWLNEGFATYVADKAVDVAEPEWKMSEAFQINTMHSILTLDATQGSHPIIQTVETPDQITEVFDTVSYNKGASVLRMLEYVVSSDNFKKGVTNYLNAHLYGNAVTQDLWDELQKVVGDELNVTEFMDTFTVQMGYPILEAKVEGNTYTFTQKRFLKDYDSIARQKNSPLNYKWSVPITYRTDLGPVDTITWFNYTSEDVTIEKPAAAKWIKFNPSQVGYYRVNYEEADWNLLIDNVKDLPLTDRTHLLEETFSIAESGDLNYTIPLKLTKYLTDEREYVPWSVASSQLQQIGKYLQTSQYDSSFKTYVVNLLKPTYDILGWDDSNAAESHLNKLCRVVILNLACTMDYDHALNEAKGVFSTWIADPTTPISTNLRTTIYKFGMVNADEATWNTVFEIFNKESDANEKLKLMNGLANVRNPSLLTKFIELAKDETYVRRQDYFTLLQYISANPVGTSIVWDYVRENWKALVDRFDINDRYLGRLIPSITNKFSTNIKQEEMQRFFENNPNAGAGAAARVQALETVANNIKWLSKYKLDVETWIKDNSA